MVSPNVLFGLVGNLGSRRWSSLARWRLRELNELPHYVQHRLDASYEAAVKYVGQFPSPLVSQVRSGCGRRFCRLDICVCVCVSCLLGRICLMSGIQLVDGTLLAWRCK